MLVLDDLITWNPHGRLYYLIIPAFELDQSFLLHHLERVHFLIITYGNKWAQVSNVTAAFKYILGA